MLAAVVDKEGPDIWQDAEVIQYLKLGQRRPEWTDTQWKRVASRAQGYQWKSEEGGGKLLKLMVDGTTRTVPPIEERLSIIKVAHVQNGHFGVRRTVSLLQPHYHWVGLWVDVATFIGQCDFCHRTRVSFNSKSPQLNSLPVVPVGVRWSVDLAGPFQNVSRQGNKYIMVCVEAYSKWVELIPIPSKEAQHTADAFLSRVIARFGAMAEVVTDRGSEWQGEFQELMQQCMVDHRLTSPAHPQANGLAERVVQSVKRSLAKMTEHHGQPAEWETYLAWVQLGYNCSVQASTTYSPYELLFAQKPVVPPAIRERCEGELSEDVNELSDQLHERALAHMDNAVIAISGQWIAQHRDQRRYAYLRSGEYNPKARRFREGDYVYVKTPKTEGMQIAVPARVLRVREVREKGTLIVEGRDGKRMRISPVNATHCHLLGMDGRMDTRQSHTDGSEVCQKCLSPYRERDMIMCDGCWKGWHKGCLPEPLSEMPEGLWACPECVQKGDTPEVLAERHVLADEQDLKVERRSRQSLTPAEKRMDAKARAWDKRFGERRMRDARTGEVRWVLGKLHYRGRWARPDLFVLVMEHGEPVCCGVAMLQDWVEEGTWRWLRKNSVQPRGVRLKPPPPALMRN